MSLAVGVDLGGTKTAAALVAADGTLGDIVTAPTPVKEGGRAVLDAVAGLIRRIATAEVTALGVGTAGVVDSVAGRIIGSTDTFTDWIGTDVAGGLRERLGWGADHAVEVINDVDAHALGEHWLGAGLGHSSMLMVAVGTGVGGSVVLDGALWTGARHVAGEIGHVPTPGADDLVCACGRRGHLEAIAAGPAIERMYGGGISGREIMARAEAGEQAALNVVTRAATGLGKAICSVVTVLDPSCVVIGGGVAQAGSVWWDPLRTTIRAELVPSLADVPVFPAAAGPSAALLGAAKRALDA